MQTFDAVAVLGKNLGYFGSRRKIQSAPNHLSRKSELSVIAAGLFFQNNQIKKIIFSGGKTVGIHYPSEAEAMAKFLKVKFPQIPDEAIILEDKSLDTKQNTECIKKIIENKQLTNVAFITTGAHIPRSNMLFKKIGLTLPAFASEVIVNKYDPVAFEEYKNEIGKKEILIEEFINIQQNLPIISSVGNYLIEKRRSLN